ncbi:peptidase M48 Ste24p [Halosimplex carlsbadense 2-9-1]|uniref:Peptidase M48 Ste24p n=1 Tax=Halosimplex carlsbadense 2-9-1 TaxID=797114 RepID=M0D396_9EURY|nr:M48 family metalloprotease [Halosimplex carlsbadense]ELZ29162.1 peptidase M48 Ste24p [Halosimplex carlsbadense 2-9-1]
MRPALALPVALALQVVVAVAVVVAVRWRGRSAHEGPAGDAETAAALRRLRRRGVVAGGVATVALTRLSGLARSVQVDATGAVTDATGPAAGTVVGVAAAVGAYALPVVAVAVVARLATVPYRRAARGFRVRYRDAAAWELERDGVGLAGVVLTAGAIALVPAGWPRVVAAVGLGLVATAVTPFALVVALRTRWPTDEELAAVDGVLPDGVRLRVVDDRTRLGSAFAAGLVPGAEYVFLTESLFDALDGDQLRAVVAHEVGHHEHEHVLLRYLLVAVAAGAALGVASVAPDVALVAVLVGTPPFAVALAWAVRRTEAQADAYAAEAVGGAALAGALETLAERRYIAEGGGPARILSHHPPLGERIEGLRQRRTG